MNINARTGRSSCSPVARLAKESKDTPANYEVADALIVPPPQAGVEFTRDASLHRRGQGAGKQGVVDRGATGLGDRARHPAKSRRLRPRASAAPTCRGASRRLLMKATLKNRVIAETDDIVEEGGYHYFPISVVRMEWLNKAPKTASDHTCPHGVQFYDVVIDG